MQTSLLIKTLMSTASLCLLLLMGVQLKAQTIVDFEDGGLLPQKTSIFDNGATTMPEGIIDNPIKSGINTSDKVFSVCKGPGAQDWGGFWLETDTASVSTFDLSEKTVFCIDVQQPRNGVVQFKIEGGPVDSIKTAIRMDYTGNGEWQQICYDFAGTPADGGQFKRIAIFPARDEKPDPEECYLIDNILHLKEVPAGDNGTVLLDWDTVDPQKASIFDQGTVVAETGKLENPNKSGINTSDNVYSMCKGPGAQPWGGFWVEVDTLDESFFDLSKGNELCIDVIMPVSGLVQLKVEQGTDAGSKTAIFADYTTPNEWQQLCYDFTGTDADGLAFRRVAVFPNKDIKPDPEECYFFDNLRQRVTVVVPPSTLPGEIVGDWETDETSPTVNVAGTGVTATKVDNPLGDNINGSTNVLQYCKDETSIEPFVGMTIVVDTFDVTGDTAQIYVSYYAADAQTVRLTLKGATDGSADVSMDVAYTTPGAWEQLIYDFRTNGVGGAEASGHIYSAIKLIPDNEVIPTAQKCYHIDDILINSNGTGILKEFISTTLGFSPSHSIFKNYVESADMTSAVNASGVTVFAPNDDAINSLSSDEKNALDNNIDGALIAFILHHITSDSLPADLLNTDGSAIARDGLDIELSADGTVGGAAVVEGDIVNSNGILHYVDAVVSTPVDPAFFVQEDFEGELEQRWFGFNWGSDSTANFWIVDNPAPDDINSSATVMHHVKYPEGNGAASWQGIALEQINRPMNVLGMMTEVCVDVLYPDAGQIRLKFSDSSIIPVAGGDPGNPRYQLEVGTPGVWQTVCADVSQPSVQDIMRPLSGDIWNKVAIFFDFATSTWPTENTEYYFDNFVFKNGSVSTDDLGGLENFSMFPNPTNDLLTLSSDTPIAYAFVYDATGKQVLVVANPLEKQLSVGHLNSGIYFIQMLNESGDPLGHVRFIKH